MSKKVYQSLVFISLAAGLVSLSLYLNKNIQLLNQFKHLTISTLFILLMMNLLNFYLLGLTQKLPINKHDIKLSFKEWFGLCLSSELLNNFLPAKSGTALRMMYLKNTKSLPIKTFLSMGFAIVFASFTLLGIFGTIYAHFYLIKKDTIFEIVECVFISLSISGVLLLFFGELISKFFKFKRQINPKFYLTDIRLISKCTILYWAIFILYPVKTYFTFKAIGISIPFIQSFEISLILILATLFQVVPGNLGIKELLFAYISSKYGIHFETALLASILDRFIMYLFLIPSGIYFYWNIHLKSNLLIVPRKKRVSLFT